MKLFLKKQKGQNMKLAARDLPKKKRRIKKQKAGFLSNTKIAPKLLAGFLIIAILSASVGIYAAVSLRGVSEASKSLYEEHKQYDTTVQ